VLSCVQRTRGITSANSCKNNGGDLEIAYHKGEKAEDEKREDEKTEKKQVSYLGGMHGAKKKERS